MPKLLNLSCKGTTTSLEMAQRILVSSYHQTSNCQAESAVRIAKSGLRWMSGGTLETKISRFLLTYRTIPHTTTGITPAELLMKRKLNKSGQVEAIHLYHCTPQPRSSEIPSWQNRQDVNVSQRPGGFFPRTLTAAPDSWPGMFWKALMPYFSW